MRGRERGETGDEAAFIAGTGGDGEGARISQGASQPCKQGLDPGLVCLVSRGVCEKATSRAPPGRQSGGWPGVQTGNLSGKRTRRVSLG